MAAEKGLEDLLAAVTSLEAGGMAVRLSVIGDGPVRAVLERQAGASGLDGRVRWHGYIADRAAYLNALRDADIFALPSRAEGVPKVLVEAMAAGLPLVAARVGAVPALLGHGERGRLVEPHDAAALATAIADLALDQAERVRLRGAGLDFAAAHTAEAQADRLVRWMRRTFPNLPWPVEQPR
jgi:glycosyltransferase involved in cell wall biosynthesis